MKQKKTLLNIMGTKSIKVHKKISRKDAKNTKFYFVFPLRPLRLCEKHFLRLCETLS